MTTITIDRALLEQALVALSAPNHCVFSEPPICVDIRAALAASATAPEKTVKEIMEFVRHYAANTFSSATLEDKIRRSLTAPATAPDELERLKTESEERLQNCAALLAEVERLRKDAERYQWLAEYLVSDDESYDDAIVAATTVAELDYVTDAAMKGTP